MNLPYSTPKAYSLSYTQEFSEKATGVFHTLGEKVRSRFSRTLKPTDHLGGLNPEERLPLIDNIERDLENWPKKGTTFEDLDICVY